MQTPVRSETIKCNSRRYFFDLWESKAGIKYLTIKESRLEHGQSVQQRLTVFEEDMQAFFDGLVNVAKDDGAPS